MNRSPLTQRPAWKALTAHYQEIKNLHLRELFAQDPSRGTRLACEGAGLFLDYSKNRLTDQTLHLLLNLANEADLEQHIQAMFRGDRINVTENRAVLHTALPSPRTVPCSTRPCVHPGTGASRWTATMWCRTSTRCWIG